MLKYTLRVFDFLRIKYPNTTDSISGLLYWLPLLLSLCICISLGILDYYSLTHLNIFTHKAIDNISTFVQILPGFYIGSLAAIASYNYDAMDNQMKNPPMLDNGRNLSALSRRQYLTSMFGYLAAISILSAIFIFFTRLVYDLQVFDVTHIIYYTLYYIIVFFFFFIFCQMISVTFFGIYYLADRMHKP